MNQLVIDFQTNTEPSSENLEINRLSALEIQDMHVWVLEESLSSMKEKEPFDEKLEILEWFFAPTYVEKIGKLDGRPFLMRKHQSDIPFSFLNACRAAGIADPDSLREQMVENIANPKLRELAENYLVQKTGWVKNKILTKSHFVAESDYEEDQEEFV